MGEKNNFRLSQRLKNYSTLEFKANFEFCFRKLSFSRYSSCINQLKYHLQM